MHGLMNRAIELFVRNTYGRKTWAEIAKACSLPAPEFEPMLCYPDDVTVAVLAECARTLHKGQNEILEDVGTFLVSHPSAEAVRRLLRFAGADFVEFLHSLDDLPARARLAVPELSLPPLALCEHSRQFFSITVGGGQETGARMSFGHVLIGLLRALADDYGALVLMEHKGWRSGAEIIEVQLLEAEYFEGRHFTLGAAE